jgi:hypothetical protein
MAKKILLRKEIIGLLGLNGIIGKIGSLHRNLRGGAVIWAS